MSIIDLQETSPDNWRAKYQGNYGIYTIKMTTNGRNYSCSCPSDYYPCKHIPMIREAINERIAKAAKSATQHKEVDIEEVLKEVSADELRAFIGRLAKYNSELSNSILLEFSQKIKVDSGNKYSAILRTALEKEVFDYDDWYEYESGIEIEALDLWLERARRYADEANYLDAVLICKACIEEYAEWLLKQDADIIDWVDESYLDTPFEILTNILSKTDIYTKDLFEYCKSEMSKEKYSKIGLEDQFNDLLSQLTPSANSAEFIALQNKLFSEVSNKSSSEAQRILQRKLIFTIKSGRKKMRGKLFATIYRLKIFAR